MTSKNHYQVLWITFAIDDDDDDDDDYEYDDNDDHDDVDDDYDGYDGGGGGGGGGDVTRVLLLHQYTWSWLWNVNTWACMRHSGSHNTT